MVVPWEGWTPGQPTKAPPHPLPPDALPFPKAYQGPVPGPVPFTVPPAQPPPGWREGDPVEQPEIPYKAPPIERPATPPFKAPPPEHLDQVAPGVFGTVAGGGGELDLAMPPPPDPPVPLFDWYRQIQGPIRNVGSGLDFGNPGVPAVLGAVRPHVEVYARGRTFICPPTDYLRCALHPRYVVSTGPVRTPLPPGLQSSRCRSKRLSQLLRSPDPGDVPPPGDHCERFGRSRIRYGRRRRPSFQDHLQGQYGSTPPSRRDCQHPALYHHASSR